MSGSTALLDRSPRSIEDYDFAVAANLTIPMIGDRLKTLKQRFFEETNPDDLTGHRLQQHFNQALAYVDSLPDCYTRGTIIVLVEEFLATCHDICHPGKQLIRRGLLSETGPDGLSTIEMKKTGDKDPKK